MIERSDGWVGRAWLALALGAVLAGGCTRPAAEVEVPPPTETTDEATATAPAGGEIAVTGIKVIEDGGQTGVFVKLSRNPDEVKHFTLASPDRLVIDLYGQASSATPPIERQTTRDPYVTRVRAGEYEGRLRVILDLKAGAPKYSLDTLDSMVVAFLGTRQATSAAPREEVLYARGDEAEKLPVATVTTTAPIEPARPRVVTSGPARRAYSGQKISLDFKDADVQNVLRILAEVGNVNIVATEDVRGRVTLRLVDVPWDQALDIVLKSARLDMVQEGNVIRVSSVTRIKEEREAQLAAEEAAKELEPLKTAFIRVNYMKVTGRAEPGAQLGNVSLGESQEVCQSQNQRSQAESGDKLVDQIKDVLSERGSVRVDARTNTVIVRDIQRGIDAAREVIAQLDIQTPQVLIESNIVEASDTFQRDLGIQWGYSYGIGPQFGTSTGKDFPASVILGGSGLGTGAVAGTAGVASQGVGGNTPPNVALPGSTTTGAVTGDNGLPALPVPFVADFPAAVQAGAGSAFDFALGSIDGSKSLNARITAFENEGAVKIISRPKVTTSNNEKACVASVTIRRVRTPNSGVQVGGGGSDAFEEFITGIVLNVVPQVSADGYILLQIKVTSSTDGSDTLDNIPSTVSREASTTVLIRDGETLVLGGVFRSNELDNERGIPYLRSIPGVGWLFKNVLRNDKREELLVFLTPRIVAGSGVSFTASLPTAKDLWANR